MEGLKVWGPAESLLHMFKAGSRNKDKQGGGSWRGITEACPGEKMAFFETKLSLMLGKKRHVVDGVCLPFQLPASKSVDPKCKRALAGRGAAPSLPLDHSRFAFPLPPNSHARPSPSKASLPHLEHFERAPARVLHVMNCDRAGSAADSPGLRLSLVSGI